MGGETSIQHGFYSSGALRFKLMFLGDSLAGKTNLVMQYTCGEFNRGYQQGLEVNQHIKMVKVDGKNLKLIMRDPSGSENCWGMVRSYYPDTDAFVLVFDTRNSAALDNIEKIWKREQAYNNRGDGQPRPLLALVGTKCDEEGSRKITADKAKQLAIELGTDYYETSARDNKGVAELFAAICQYYQTQVLPELKDEAVSAETPLLPEKSEETSGKRFGCCLLQ